MSEERYENELHGQDGSIFQQEALREFQKFDLFPYLSTKSDEKIKFLQTLSQILFKAIVTIAKETPKMKQGYEMDDLSAGDWASVIQLLGGKIVQHSSIVMFEDSKKDLT